MSTLAGRMPPGPRRGVFPGAERAVGRAIGAVAHALALVGGILFTALAVLTTVSIVGRGFVFAGLGPIPGDFELVEAGTAIAVFAFLPWCQLKRGHVTVEVLVARFPPRVRAFLGLVGNLALTVAAVLIAWRMWAGMTDKFRFGETTMILRFEIGWAYAFAMVGAIAFAVTAAYTVWRSLNETIRGEDPLPAGTA